MHQQKLPFLPGMVFNDPSKQNFSKPQNFKINSNTLVEQKKLVIPKPTIEIDVDIQKRLQNKQNLEKLLIQANTSKENLHSEELKEKLLTLKVLRFWAYMK